MEPEKIEIIIKAPTKPRVAVSKQVKIEESLAAAVMAFALQSRRTQSNAYEYLLESAMLSKGAKYEGANMVTLENGAVVPAGTMLECDKDGNPILPAAGQE